MNDEQKRKKIEFLREALKNILFQFYDEGDDHLVPRCGDKVLDIWDSIRKEVYDADCQIAALNAME